MLFFCICDLLLHVLQFTVVTLVSLTLALLAAAVVFLFHFCHILYLHVSAERMRLRELTNTGQAMPRLAVTLQEGIWSSDVLFLALLQVNVASKKWVRGCSDYLPLKPFFKTIIKPRRELNESD